MKVSPRPHVLSIAIFVAVATFVGETTRAQESAVDGPDLAIEALTLIGRSETGVTYRCVIRNVGLQPTPENYSVSVQAYLSPERTGERVQGAVGAGGYRFEGCAGLAPGEICTVTKPASLKQGDFRYLVVTVTPIAFRTYPDPDRSNNTVAISLDAAVEAPPAPDIAIDSVTLLRRSPQGPSSVRPRHSSMPTPWYVTVFLSAFGILWAVLFFGIFSLVILSVMSALRPVRKIPSRFRSARPGEQVDRADLERAAQSIGFERLPEAPLGLRTTLEMLVGADEVSDAMQRRVRGGTFTLCDYQRKIDRSTSRENGPDRHWTVITYYTALVFTAERDIYFPPFSVSPNRKPNDLLMKLVGRLMGGRIRFAEDPDFHRRVLVATFLPKAVRPLLSARVREVLKKNEDLTATVSERTIIVYREDHKGRQRPGRGGDVLVSQTVDPADWPSFCKAAVAVINSIRKSEVTSRALRPTAAETAGARKR